MLSYAEPTVGFLSSHHRQRDLVNKKTRRRIFNWVLVGHILGLVLPLTLGILMGFFEPKELTTITLDITDFESDLSGPSALESGTGLPPPPPPIEEPEIPQTPDIPTPPEVPAPPTITPPLVQTSDSLERPIKPPPPPDIRKPTIKKPDVAKATPPVVPKKGIKTPKVDKTPKKTSANSTAKNDVYNDKFDPTKLGDGVAKGGTNRVAGGTGSGGTDESGNGGAYDLRLKAYIELNWIRPTYAALGGQNPTVRILLDIAPDGRVLQRKIEKASGMALMDDSVQKLLLKLDRVPAPNRLMRNKPIVLVLEKE